MFFMRAFPKKISFPLTAAIAALMVTPLVAQQTSEESGKAGQTQKKAAVVARGQIIITDGNGKVEVLELKGDGEKQIVLRQEKEEKSEDAHHGKIRAILVGPDGKHEVQLQLEGEGGNWVVDGDKHTHLLQLHSTDGDLDLAPLMANLSMHVGGFMIGVSCDSIGDTLKSQLGIEHGLAVESVVPDSPAANKILDHDILLRADDTDLDELEQLIEAVQSAGEAEKELKLTLLRGGKEVSVSVTPQKREMPEGVDIEVLGESGALLQLHPELKSVNGFSLETIGPGVIEWRSGDENSSADAMKAEIDSLRKQLEALSSKLEGKK
jgi:hypothetical protein